MSKLALEHFLPYRLNRLSSAVSQQFRAVYGPHHDLTVPEWRVLATLAQFGTIEIPRDGYRGLLDDALRHPGDWQVRPLSGREALASL